MPFELFFPYSDSQYNDGILLEEYNGEYSLVQAQKGDDGQVYKRWAFPQINRDPAGKAIPIKIRLGSPRQAVVRLRKILEQLTNEVGDTQPPTAASMPEEDDMPF